MKTKPPLLLQPFQGVLPSRDKAHLVATRSYLSYSDYELQDKLARNPYSYLHVIHPDGDLDSSKDLQAVRKAYTGFLERGWLERDERQNYYVLSQSGPMGTCTGVVGLIPTSEAQAGRIKVHEATLANRENLFARYLSEVGLNAEPTLLAHAHNPLVDEAIGGVTNRMQTLISPPPMESGTPCGDRQRLSWSNSKRHLQRWITPTSQMVIIGWLRA